MVSSEEIETMVEDAEEEIEPLGFIDRVINVYLDPGSLFKYLTIKPDFITPWIVVGLVTIIMTAVIFPQTYELGWDPRQLQLETRGASEDEITEKAEEYMNPSTRTRNMAIQSIAAGVLVPIAWLISGGILFLISLIQGLEAKFKRIFSVVAYTSMIGMLGSVVIDRIIKLVQGAETLADWQRSKISLAAIFPPETHQAISMPFSILDPFFIWSMVVLVIGLTYANRCKRGQAITTAVIYVVLIAVFLVGVGFLMQLVPGFGGGGNVQVEVG